MPVMPIVSLDEEREIRRKLMMLATHCPVPIRLLGLNSFLLKLLDFALWLAEYAEKKLRERRG